MNMKRATHLIFTFAFSVGCFALWMVLSLYLGIYHSLFHSTHFPYMSQLPELTQLLLDNRLAFLLMPIPFTLYSVFRKPLTFEGIVFYFGLLAFLFMILLLLVLAAVLLPMVPYSDAVSPG